MMNKYYPTVDECLEVAYNPEYPYDLFNDCHFFDGTLQYQGYDIVTDANGGRKKVVVTKTLPDLGFDASTLENYWSLYYGDCRVAHPLKPNRDTHQIDDDSWQNCYYWMRARVRAFCNANKYRYIKLVASLDLDYDPISNYDMMEIGVAKGDKGESYVERANGSGREITSTTVVPNATVTIINTGENPDNFIAGSVGVGGAGDTVETEADSNNKPTTTNSVTTYDSNTPVTLSKSESQGKSKTTSKQDPKFSTTVSTGVRGWKDTTKTTTPSEDYHNLNRQGNIGVTTTQDMIDKERDIARYSVIEEFMNDLKREICLKVWH